MMKRPHFACARILLIAAMVFPLVGRSAAAEAPAAEEPLILEYRCGFLKQEIVVFEQMPFRTKTQVEHQHWIISGTIGKIVDDAVAVDFDVDYKFVDEDGTAGQSGAFTLALKVNEMRGELTGGAGSMMGNVLITDIWLRRGLDPMPHVLQLLTEAKDVPSFFAAIAYLWEMGPRAHQAIPALIAALEHQDKQIRVAAIRSLGRIGRDARAAISTALEEAMEDQDADIRMEASRALKEINP